MTKPPLPDEQGHFGQFGGRFVPEALQGALNELGDVFATAQADPAFAAELNDLRVNYAGRPTPITQATRPPSITRDQEGRRCGSLLRTRSPRETR